MRYKDPLDVTCPSCDKKSPQRVKELLRLTATCPKCSASLRDVGNGMRAQLNEVGTYFGTIELALALADATSVELTEPEIESAATPWDLVVLCAHKSGQSADLVAEQALTWLKRTLPERDDLDLHKPLADLFAKYPAPSSSEDD